MTGGFILTSATGRLQWSNCGYPPAPSSLAGSLELSISYFHESSTFASKSLPQGFLLRAAELRFSLPGQFFWTCPLLQRKGLLHSRVSSAVLWIPRLDQVGSSLSSSSAISPHKVNPLNLPFPMLLGSLLWWKLVASVPGPWSRVMDLRHSTVLTHKGSCTCFDLHFSNASGGISIS